MTTPGAGAVVDNKSTTQGSVSCGGASSCNLSIYFSVPGQEESFENLTLCAELSLLGGELFITQREPDSQS